VALFVISTVVGCGELESLIDRLKSQADQPNGQASATPSPTPRPVAPLSQASFAAKLYPVLRAQCGSCHATLQPYLASDDPRIAYAAARALVDPEHPEQSILVFYMKNNHTAGAFDPEPCLRAFQAWVDAEY
jgi:hypothetical protein